MERKEKILYGMGGILVVLLAAAFISRMVGADSPVPFTLNLFAMDTVITMEVYGEDGSEAVGEAERMIGKLESLWSATDESSEIYAVSHSNGKPVPVSEETRNLMEYALQMADETDGAFNPALYPVIKAWGFPNREYRILEEKELKRLLAYTDYREIRLENGTAALPEHMEVDFGAIAKGYAGDLIVEFMKAHGIRSGIINLGGNVALIGKNPDGTPWKVGIRSPYGDGTIGVLEAEDCHIITSGGYERYFTGEDGTVYWHILDPKDGRPAESGIISATIIGKEGRLCDALSTAVFVMGREQAEAYWQTHKGFEMILVTENNEVYVTDGIREQFRLGETSAGIPVYVINREEKIQ